MEDAMKGWHNFILENQVLHQLEGEVAHLTVLLHEEQNKNATAHYMGYRQGWNDCEKKDSQLHGETL